MGAPVSFKCSLRKAAQPWRARIRSGAQRNLGSALEKRVLFGIIIREIVDFEGRPFDRLSVDLDAEPFRRDRSVARGEREIVVVEAARREHRGKSEPGLVVDETEALILLFVSADERLDPHALKERSRLQFSEWETRALFLKRGRDDIGRARIAPHHLERISSSLSVERSTQRSLSSRSLGMPPWTKSVFPKKSIFGRASKTSR